MAASAARPSLPTTLVLLLPGALTLWFATMLPTIAGGETIRFAVDWVAGLDVALSFYVDGLSLLFALLISLIGFFIFLYARSYLAGDPQFGRFMLYLSLFMLAMLGVVLADNVITLFVFWELTSLTSYLLIGYNHADPKSRRNALQALVVTGSGGLALLAGLILLGLVAGSFELSAINAAGDVVRAHDWYLGILILVLLGAFTKSAQFPFHFWLPNAMAAPTPVSAYLHSATMVKAGVYLMARVHPSLGNTDVWLWTLTIAGAVTAVWASILALRQTDLKPMLAYTTLMALGTLTMFLANSSELAITAVVVFILVHSFYKATLFMVAGAIDHETGTREIARLGGLARLMPFTFFATALATLSMAGVPPFAGFIGKELKYKGALAVASEPTFVAIAALAANAMMVAVAAIIAIKPFLGPKGDTPKSPHEAPWTMWIGPIVLASLGLACGLAPGLLLSGLVEAGVASILALPEPTSYPLQLWHGINLPLLMSVITVGLGAVLFWQWPRVRATIDRACKPLPVGDDIYDWCMKRLVDVAEWQTALLQTGSQKRYVLVVFATLTLSLGITLIVRDAIVLPSAFPQIEFYKWAVVGLIIAATAVTVFAKSRLTAICALGVIGTSVALLFVMYGAPDVAMTQLMVEILIVIIVALVMLRLPAFRDDGHGDRTGHIRDASVAVGTGLVVSLTLLAVLQYPIDRRLTDFFEANSYPEALGRNIVNVILVDFRAIDTFGEIAVVAIAGLACFALIRLRPKRKPRPAEPGASAPTPAATPAVGGDD